MPVTSKKRLEIEERRKSVALNVVAGMTYRDIAEGLKVSIGTISSDMKVILKRLQAEQLKEASEIVLIEIRRIDVALNAIFDKVRGGDLSAIDTMIKLQSQRAKYLGLFAPEQLEVFGKKGRPIETQDIGAIRDKRWADAVAAIAEAMVGTTEAMDNDPKPPEGS